MNLCIHECLIVEIYCAIYIKQKKNVTMQILVSLCGFIHFMKYHHVTISLPRDWFSLDGNRMTITSLLL